MYGQELNMPVGVKLSLPPGEKFTSERLYNWTTHGEVIKAGDIMWYANKLLKKGVTPKLQPKQREVLALFLKEQSEVLAEVQLSSWKNKTMHTDPMKPCYSRNLPGWLRIMKKQLI